MLNLTRFWLLFGMNGSLHDLSNKSNLTFNQNQYSDASHTFFVSRLQWKVPTLLTSRQLINLFTRSFYEFQYFFSIYVIYFHMRILWNLGFLNNSLDLRHCHLQGIKPKTWLIKKLSLLKWISGICKPLHY